MSLTPESFVVRVDPEALRTARTRMRRSWRVLGWTLLLVGLAFVCGGLIMLREGGALFAGISPWWLIIVFGAVQVLLGALFASLRFNPNPPEIAFALTASGIEFHYERGMDPIPVAWDSIRGFARRGKTLRFFVEPGVLPPRFKKNLIYYGWPVLDQTPTAIEAAISTLSGGRVAVGGQRE